MNILFNTYEPGLTDNNFKTAMALAGAWSWLDEKLAKNQMYLQNVSVGESSNREDIFNYWLAQPENVDMIFLCWRWKMPNIERYQQRNEAYSRQMMLINFAIKHNIPVYIHDCDMEGDSIAEAGDVLYNAGCVFEIGVPCLVPPAGCTTMFFPCQHDLENYVYVPLKDRVRNFVYVGNNYDRYDQMKNILINHPSGSIFGHWIGSRGAENLFDDFPTMKFEGRSDQKDLINILSHSRYTIHFGKKQYMSSCFISPRWHEAAAAGLINFQLPSYTFCDVRSELDCFNPNHSPESDDEYRSILESQLKQVRLLVGTEDDWLSTFERLAKFRD